MEPTPGDINICSMCHEAIVYVGPYWQHQGENQPRHPAWPVEEEQQAADPQTTDPQKRCSEYIVATPAAALVANTDWLRIWLNGMAATDKRLVAVYHTPSTWQPVFIFEDTSE